MSFECLLLMLEKVDIFLSISKVLRHFLESFYEAIIGYNFFFVLEAFFVFVIHYVRNSKKSVFLTHCQNFCKVYLNDFLKKNTHALLFDIVNNNDMALMIILLYHTKTLHGIFYVQINCKRKFQSLKMVSLQVKVCYLES